MSSDLQNRFGGEMAYAETCERVVDWASALTWCRFVALSVVVSIALVLCNLALISGVHLAISMFDAGASHGFVAHGGTATELPLKYELPASLMLWLFLFLTINRLAYRSPSWTAPDDFPMHLLEAGKKNNFGWLGLILALNGILGVLLSIAPIAGYLLAHTDPGFLTFSAVTLFICKDGLRALFWRVLADDEPATKAISTQSTWVALDPGLAIAIIAVITWIFLLLTVVMARGLAWL